MSQKNISLLDKVSKTKKNILGLLNRSIKPEEINSYFITKQPRPAKELLKRTGFSIFDLPVNFIKDANVLPPWLFKDILFDIESDIKYEGYIKRHLKEIKKLKKHDETKIPREFNYEELGGLSKEAVEKLSFVKPETVGQASRISGIKPSDSTILMLKLLN